MRRRRLVLLAAAAAAGAAAVALVVLRPGGDDTVDLLPDLDQAAPGQLRGRAEETPAGPRFFLGFESAAGNAGDGPLELVGRREGAGPELRLVQEIGRSDGSRRTVPLRASLRYVRSATHSHWHLLGFMRYELRTPDGTALRDRKTGFCLGDRYALRLELPREARTPRFTDECGRGRPDLRRLRAGISVGWGDDYAPHLEGQEFEVTDLPAGRYLLVHRVNPERVLVESDYGDNVASLAFALSWPEGRARPPRVDVIARCPESAACG